MATSYFQSATSLSRLYRRAATVLTEPELRRFLLDMGELLSELPKWGNVSAARRTRWYVTEARRRFSLLLRMRAYPGTQPRRRRRDADVVNLRPVKD